MFVIHLNSVLSVCRCVCVSSFKYEHWCCVLGLTNRIFGRSNNLTYPFAYCLLTLSLSSYSLKWFIQSFNMHFDRFLRQSISCVIRRIFLDMIDESLQSTFSCVYSRLSFLIARLEIKKKISINFVFSFSLSLFLLLAALSP